jgi:hypothetical protein
MIKIEHDKEYFNDGLGIEEKRAKEIEKAVFDHLRNYERVTETIEWILISFEKEEERVLALIVLGCIIENDRLKGETIEYFSRVLEKDNHEFDRGAIYS